MDSHSPHDGESRRKRQKQSHSTTVAIRMKDATSSPQELGHMRPSHQGSSSFVGSGSGIHFVRTVQSAFARNYWRVSESIHDALVPGEDDRLRVGSPGGAALWLPDEISPLSEGHYSNPSWAFDDLVLWSEPYFTNWHAPFPFLHGPSILRLLERISLDGIQSLSMVDFLTVRSVFSISVADRRQMPPGHRKLVPSSLVFNTIDEVISCLTPVLLEPSTLNSLQALVGMQLFLVSMLRLNAASKVGGLITRISVHCGLHRCPSRYAQFSPADADMRRRVFWTIYCLERYLSQSLGLPLNIKDDDVDVCYPDKELHADELPTNSFRQPGDQRLLLLPAFLARHGYIKGLILELRHKSVNHRTTDPDEVARVESEISKWWNEAQDILGPQYMDSEVNGEPAAPEHQNLLTESQKLLLVVQKHESTILLNRPVITSAPNHSLFSSAMQKCIGASKQIVAKLYDHLHTGMNEGGTRDGRVNNPLFWPGFTWCTWMSGLILLYAASEGHYSVQIAQREAERCTRILEALSLRGNFWPGACATALRDLQNALLGKFAIGSLEAAQASETRRFTNMPHPNSNGVQHSETHLQGGSLPSDSTLRGTESVFPFLTSLAFRSISSQRSQFSGSFNEHDVRGPATSNTATAFQTTQPPYMQQAIPSDPTLMPGTNGPFDWMSDQFDGVGDIFQLIDASYNLGERFFEPTFGERY